MAAGTWYLPIISYIVRWDWNCLQDLGVPGDLAEVLEVVDAVETFRQPAAPEGQEIVEVRRAVAGLGGRRQAGAAHQQGMVFGPETGRITGVVEERAELFARLL